MVLGGRDDTSFLASRRLYALDSYDCPTYILNVFFIHTMERSVHIMMPAAHLHLYMWMEF